MIDYISEMLRSPAFWYGAATGLVLIAVVVIVSWATRAMFRSGSQTQRRSQPKPGHVPPCAWSLHYSPRDRGFTNITICDQCGVRGQYWDLHPVNPCYRCGGKRRETTGRWTGTEWITADESRRQREGL